MEWLDLFKKKSGGSDWGDALMQEISTENDTPQTLQIEDTFEKLTEWKSSPFCIVDEHDVLGMIKEKTAKVAKHAKISKTLAHSVLVKNDWDEAKALIEMKAKTYLDKNFQYN